MADQMTRSEQVSRPDGDRTLAEACQRALDFPLSRANSLVMTAQQASEQAEQEAAFSIVSVDNDGMSSGMNLALLPPVRAIQAEWQHCQEEFRIQLQSKMPDIQAVGLLETEAKALIQKRDEELEAVERELQASPRYYDIDLDKKRSQSRYDEFVYRYSNRSATVFAYSYLYWILIALVGITECLINYRVFLEFFGVVAFAAGATLLLGALLALCSHVHGEMFKQASFRFNHAREPAKRWSDWRVVGLCGFGLIVLLSFTAGARYFFVLQHLSTSIDPNPLSPEGAVNVSPLRDVMVSLLANVAAYLVGLIIAYNAHDPDPEYMEATRQYRHASEAWSKARDSKTEKIKHIEAKYAGKIRDKQAAAETRLGSVSRERDMLRQVEEHDRAIRHALQTAIDTNAEMYRDALARIALSRAGKLQLVLGADRTPITPFDYKAMPISSEKILQKMAVT